MEIPVPLLLISSGAFPCLGMSGKCHSYSSHSVLKGLTFKPLGVMLYCAQGGPVPEAAVDDSIDG